MTESSQLRLTFDSAADLYENARPSYPDALYDALIATTGLTPSSRLLEIGCATGKATVPLARGGYSITCVEPGPKLAAVARHNLREFPDVTVRETRFEDLQPDQFEPVDLIFAATAWHWIDPAKRYRQAWQLLRPGGYLAFWSATHTFPDGGDQIFADLQAVYDEIGEGLPDGASFPRPGDLPDQLADISNSGLFEPVMVREFDWEVTYDAESYIRLLNTFSGHIAMRPWQRDRLYSEIRRRLAQRGDGRLRRGWGAVLHIARRSDTNPENPSIPPGA